MNKEKSAFPNSYNTEDGNGITYRQYLAARVYPEMINIINAEIKDKDQKYYYNELFASTAELTWQAVDALIEAEVKE